jgi:hypothetical protein
VLVVVSVDFRELGFALSLTRESNTRINRQDKCG